MISCMQISSRETFNPPGPFELFLYFSLVYIHFHPFKSSHLLPIFLSSRVFSFCHLSSNSHQDSPKTAHSVDSSPAEYPSLQSPPFCPHKEILSEKRVASHTVSLRQMNHAFGCGTVYSRKIVGGQGLNLGLTLVLMKVEKEI